MFWGGLVLSLDLVHHTEGREEERYIQNERGVSKRRDQVSDPFLLSAELHVGRLKSCSALLGVPTKSRTCCSRRATACLEGIGQVVAHEPNVALFYYTNDINDDECNSFHSHRQLEILPLRNVGLCVVWWENDGSIATQ